MLLFLSRPTAVGEIGHPLHRCQQGTRPEFDGRSLENAQMASACAGPARQRHGFTGCCAQGLVFLLLVLGMDTCTPCLVKAETQASKATANRQTGNLDLSSGASSEGPSLA